MAVIEEVVGMVGMVVMVGMVGGMAVIEEEDSAAMDLLDNLVVPEITLQDRPREPTPPMACLKALTQRMLQNVRDVQEKLQEEWLIKCVET